MTDAKKQILLNHVIDVSTHPKFHQYKKKEPRAVRAAFLIILLRLLKLKAELS